MCRRPNQGHIQGNPYNYPYPQDNAQILMIGQYEGSNPTNHPILSKTMVNSDMKGMNNTLPMEAKATIKMPIETNGTIEMTLTPIWS